MKKVIIMLFAFSLIFLTGCESTINENSGKGEKAIHVLIGGEYGLTSSRYNISELAEVQSSTTTIEHNFPEPMKEISFNGAEFRLQPWTAVNSPDREGVVAQYSDSELNFIFSFEERTGLLISFTFLDFPEGYILHSEQVDPDTALERVADFMKSNLPHINLNEWQYNDDTDNDNAGRYTFKFYKYKNDIKVGIIIIYADNCGNINYFGYKDVEHVYIPEFDDIKYISAAKTRIDEFYKDKTDVKDIDSYNLFEKKIVYLHSHNCYAIEFGVSFNVNYIDGTVDSIENSFYYLIENEAG